MQMYKYPKMAEHVAIHQSFVEEVLAVREKMKTSTFLISMKVYHFLKNWLIEHIQGTDKEYTDFFKNHKLEENIKPAEITQLKLDLKNGLLIKFD